MVLAGSTREPPSATENSASTSPETPSAHWQGQTSAGGKDAFVSLHDESGTLKWIRQFGSTDSREDVATGVAGDGSGAYVVGYTQAVLPSQSRVDGFDSFIRKYDANGVALWTRQFGSLTDDFAQAVATHPSGVYVVGQVDCCAGALPGQPPTAGADAYVKKFGGDGNEMWTRMISTPNTERAFGVAVDGSGVYVAGTTNGELASPSGQRDGFVRKYDHDGALLWTRQFGTSRADGVAANDDVFAVAAGAGGVFVAGATAQGAAPGDTFAGGLWGGFVIKFDPDGASQWYRQIGTEGDEYAYGIAVGEGHVLVAGGTGSNLVSGAFVGGEDAFLRLYDFDGNVLSTPQFGNGLNDSGRGVVAYPAGFFLGGTKNGKALDLEPIGDSDSFVMKITPPPFVREGGVLNAESFAASPAPLAPGSMAVVSGAYLNNGSQALSTSIGPDGRVVTSLGGTQITVNNIPAPILSSIPSQVTIQIPDEPGSRNRRWSRSQFGYGSGSGGVRNGQRSRGIRRRGARVRRTKSNQRPYSPRRANDRECAGLDKRRRPPSQSRNHGNRTIGIRRPTFLIRVDATITLL